jgi:hypothetical protein
MLSNCAEGVAWSSWTSLSLHCSYSLSAARRSPAKVSDSILARIASSHRSSSSNIRSANSSIWRVWPCRRQSSTSRLKAPIILGSSRACSRSFHNANSPASGMSNPSRKPARSKSLPNSEPGTTPEVSRSMSRSSTPAFNITQSLVDSSAPGARRGRRIESAVARECRASAVGALGHNNSAKRSRR